MQRRSIGRVVLLFLLTLLIYVLLWKGDTYLRTSSGPWELEFSAEGDGTPILMVGHQALGITNTVLRFEGETVSQEPRTVRFTGPGIDIPFGEVVFFDTTYLPGTVTLDLFGHVVEFMKRTLVIDYREHAWRSGETIHLDRDTLPCWELKFDSDQDGTPILRIGQDALGISDVALRLEGELAPVAPVRLRMVEVPESLPFGRLVSFDASPLPGRLDLDLFGHRVVLTNLELLLDGTGHFWTTGATHVLD